MHQQYAIVNNNIMEGVVDVNARVDRRWITEKIKNKSIM